jgi:hypothetical protein
MLATVVISTWLAIFGPLPLAVGEWIKQWQTLLSAAVASIAACIAFTNTSRTLKHAEALETHRRKQKLKSIRAIMPNMVSQLIAYAEASAISFAQVSLRHQAHTIPPSAIPVSAGGSLQEDALEELSQLIEYADNTNTALVEDLAAWMQIHHARTSTLIANNQSPSNASPTLRVEVQARAIDAASIYAAASALFDYARRRNDQLPTAIDWNSVRHALQNMKLWESTHPELYEMVESRKAISPGPFASLHK